MSITVDPELLEKHVRRLCLRNLRSSRVVCCAACPFEPIIVSAFPETKALFQLKRAQKGVQSE